MASRFFDTSIERKIYWGALFCFLVAGVTGVFFRFQMAYGWESPFDLGDIRHAHSHLMYFGWGTPALMALIWHILPDRTTDPYNSLFWGIAGWTLGAALLSYPFFLLFGYAPVQVGSARLPLAAVGASLNIFGWYGFGAVYLAATRGMDRTRPLQLWDVALLALLISTFGAWGLALIGPLGGQDPLWTQALLHVFLDLFSEGWFVLGVLGLAYAMLRPKTSFSRRWPLYLVALGLPFSFLLSLPSAQIPSVVEGLGRGGGVLVAVGLFVMACPLLRTPSGRLPRWVWGVPVGLLVVKATAQLGGSLIPGLWLGEGHDLRIFYLHVMLLGFLSLGLVAASRQAWDLYASREVRWFYGAIGAVLVSLLLLTPWVPVSTNVAYHVVAWVAGLPVVAAGLLLGRGLSAPAGSKVSSSMTGKSD